MITEADIARQAAIVERMAVAATMHGLSGLGRFKVKKAFKKVVTAHKTLVKKVVDTGKKIAPVAVVAAAAYYGGPVAAQLVAERFGKKSVEVPPDSQAVMNDIAAQNPQAVQALQNQPPEVLLAS